MEKLIILTAMYLLVQTQCSNSIGPSAVAYEPPVVFSGFINGAFTTLPGNTTWRNTCRLAGDTIRMYFYSAKFTQEDQIRTGDLIRLDILPSEEDTLIKTGGVLFHLARYAGYNRSYYIVPADSSDPYKYVRMRVHALSPRPDKPIEIDHIVIRTPVVPTTHGENLEISDARIAGRVENKPFEARFSLHQSVSAPAVSHGTITGRLSRDNGE